MGNSPPRGSANGHDEIEVAVEQRLGPLERIDHDGQLAQRGTDRTRTWTLIPGDDGRLTLIVR